MTELRLYTQPTEISCTACRSLIVCRRACPSCTHMVTSSNESSRPDARRVARGPVVRCPRWVRPGRAPATAVQQAVLAVRVSDAAEKCDTPGTALRPLSCEVGRGSSMDDRCVPQLLGRYRSKLGFIDGGSIEGGRVPAEITKGQRPLIPGGWYESRHHSWLIVARLFRSTMEPAVSGR